MGHTLKQENDGHGKIWSLKFTHLLKKSVLGEPSNLLKVLQVKSDTWLKVVKYLPKIMEIKDDLDKKVSNSKHHIEM